MNRIRERSLDGNGGTGRAFKIGGVGLTFVYFSSNLFKIETRKTQRLQKTGAFATLKGQSVLFPFERKTVDAIGTMDQLISDPSFSAYASFLVVADLKMFQFTRRTVKSLHAHFTNMSVF